MADERYKGVLRDTDARLIHQSFQSRMVDLGYGEYIFDWEYMPEDARTAWVECVSLIVNDRLSAAVSILAQGLGVPHYTDRN